MPVKKVGDTLTATTRRRDDNKGKDHVWRGEVAAEFWDVEEDSPDECGECELERPADSVEEVSSLQPSHHAVQDGGRRCDEPGKIIVQP